MPWAAAAAAAVGVAGSAMQGSAAKGAAKSAAAAQMQMYNQSRADLAPFREAGVNALSPQQALLGLQGPEAADAAMANYRTSPGYEFQVAEGMRAVESSAAAGGMLRSGATLKALQERGQGLAAQDFGTYYNRLMGLTNMGQASAAGSAAAATSTGAGVAQTQMAGGQAQGNMYANIGSTIGGAANTYANYSMYNDRTNALAPENTSGGGPPKTF